ncbi:MAG TPA: hypothetical protein VMD47_10610 [Candidatus Acidoferrales bacterium]|nr:hypothetical protein [Candidatus Acidoferrales bacterium]
MSRSTNGADVDERTMRRQILVFLDEYCRSLTLQDVREWYVDVFPDVTPAAPCAEGVSLNAP